MYCDILLNYVLPFAADFNYGNIIIHQDNASTHTGQPAKSFLPQLGLIWVRLISNLSISIIQNSICLCQAKSPAKSPDLNPIEWVWSDLKRFIRKYYCKTVEDVLNAVNEFHSTITPDYCRRYIDRLKKEIDYF